MSYIDLTKTVAPSIPASNHVEVYVDTADKHLKTIDDVGTIHDLVGVTSVHADANPNLTGDVQLVSGTNVTLSQVGQAITVNATSGGTVNSGTAGRLSLYATSTNAVSDTYIQNTHPITLAIASQGSRSADLALTIPNPGNAVTSANVVLDVGNYTIGGLFTFSKPPTLPINSFSGTGTVTPDATTSSTFFTTVTGTLTIDGPTGGVDGQKLTFRILNDASHSVTFATGAGNFRFGTDITSYTNSVSKTDYIGVIWNNAAGVWDIVSVIQGF